MRFLFCSLSSPGFLYPALGIAEQLRRRNHEVAFVTDLASVDAVVRAGFPRLARGERDGPSFQVQHWGVALSIAIQAKHVEYALAQYAADVLVGQPLTLGPMIVAERRRIPLGVVGLAPFLWPYPAGPASGSPGRVPDIVARRAWRYADGLRIYNDARRLFGLAATDPPPDANPFLGNLYLLQSSPLLAGSLEHLPARVHLVGACLWEPPREPDDELDTWLDGAARDGRPVVYVQQARSFDAPRFWPNLVQTLDNLDVRAVASLARMDRAVGEVPGNVLVRRHVSQAHVLTKASAAIGSGTTTAVLGALVHGVPSILLPAGGEQEDLAEQCAHAGVAESLPPDADAGTIRNAIGRVLEDRSMARSAATVGAELLEAGGHAAAARLLERLAATGQPVERDVAPPRGQ